VKTEAAAIILEQKEIPLVFLSSHTEPDVVEKTEGITSYGYIVKNSGVTVLLASIKMAFRLFEAKKREQEKEQALRDSENTIRRKLDAILDPEGDPGVLELRDLVTPVYVGEHRLGAIILGRFLFDDDEVDPELFRAWAVQSGADEEQSLQALEQVPRRPKETVESAISLYAKFAAQFARLGYSNLKLARVLEEHKAYEKRLLESEEKYRLIAEHTSDGILVFENGAITYASPAYMRRLGYGPGEALGRTEEGIMALVHPEDRDGVLQKINLAKEGGESGLTYQFRVLHKDGHYIWREDHASFVYDGEGALARVYVMARDITERKHNELIILNARNEYRQLFEVMKSGLLSLDPEGRVTSANTAAFEDITACIEPEC
jgi:PAS domain S-box-containing protein